MFTGKSTKRVGNGFWDVLGDHALLIGYFLIAFITGPFTLLGWAWDGRRHWRSWGGGYVALVALCALYGVCAAMGMLQLVMHQDATLLAWTLGLWFAVLIVLLAITALAALILDLAGTFDEV